MSDDTQDGILDLWPTKIMRRRLPDFEDPTQALGLGPGGFEFKPFNRNFRARLRVNVSAHLVGSGGPLVPMLILK